MDVYIAVTWMAFGVLVGWSFAVLMGETRKSETTIRNQITSQVSAETCMAIASAVVSLIDAKGMVTADWSPGRWWRVIKEDGQLWAETSDEVEAREIAADSGLELQRLWVRDAEKEWRTVKCET